MREKEAFWIIIRNLRKPLLVLIVTYGVSALLLTMADGIDAKGNHYNLTFFDAFYIISYTATTIGYGEIPYAFTYPQRMAMVISIYITVPAWFYAIGKILQLVQDKAFQTSIKHITFKKQISKLKEDFIVICGYNTISKLMIEKFQHDGDYRIVILDKQQEKIEELLLEDYYPTIPALAADATLTSVLSEAGVSSPYCKALVTLFEDDDINLKVAVKAKILNKDLDIIAESSFSAGIQNLEDVGVEHVIDPYSLVANRVEYMLNAPHIHALLNWLGGASLYTGRKGKLPRGKYIICSRGRLGRAVKEVLLKNGIEYEIVDILKETKAKDGGDRELLVKAGISEASCLIAGTPDDAVNLSIILTARKIRPDIYVMVRENKTEENSVFAALRADKVFVMDKIIAVRAYNLISRPLVVKMADMLTIKSDSWAEHIVDRLTEIINKKPNIVERTIGSDEAYALNTLLESKTITYKDLISNIDGEGRELDLMVLGVMHTSGEFILGPSFVSEFKIGDKLLIAGTDDAIYEFDEILNNVNKLYFVVNKMEKRDWFFEKFFPKNQ